jgi:hypothetical protein
MIFEEQIAAYHALLTKLAEGAYSRYCANPAVPLYLMGTRGHVPGPGNVWTSWVIGDDSCGTDFLPVSQNRLPRNLTVEGMLDHLKALTRGKPCWLFAQ